jgi:ABC-type phosphonate transport system ATPase subunit
LVGAGADVNRRNLPRQPTSERRLLRETASEVTKFNQSGWRSQFSTADVGERAITNPARHLNMDSEVVRNVKRPPSHVKEKKH